MSENVMLREAIDALHHGQRARARDLLTRLLRADQSDPQYWLWMSATVETAKEQIYCLQTVLRMDPGNKTARQGLVLLGALAPDQNVQPVPPQRRQWEVPLNEEPKPTGLRAVLANPVMRAGFFGLLGLLVIALILGGIFGLGYARKTAVAVKPTKTPGPPPTFTSTPTYLPGVGGLPTEVTPSPTFVGPTPLWMALEATFTPTPQYVNTPHAIIEAYRTAIRFLERGDLQGALRFMQQASQVDPDASDIQYHIGDIQYQLGNYEQALQAFNQAIKLNANFGPAYLGRARASLAQDPKSDVSQDLDLAIERDANLGEAYLARASFLLEQGQAEAALEDIQSAEELLPESPTIFIYRSQAELAQKEYRGAYEDAQKAVEMDRTSLPGFLALGQAAVEVGEYGQAIEALKVYLSFHEEDAAAWLALGKAYYQSEGKALQAMEALDQALQLDKRLAEAYLYRGLLHLEDDEGQEAVNDFMSARRFDSRSFLVNLGLGRALFASNRLGEARGQLNSTLKLAETDAEQAQVYYWRAQVLEAYGIPQSAAADWEALLALPSEVVPREWYFTARRGLIAYYTPVPTFPPPSGGR